MNTDFMGQDGFIWFVAVVEDRQDPLKLGRVRVRCLGYHTENKEELPTADLPWAHPLQPITSSGISGIGHTPLGLVEGSWVVGFFRDAATLQDAVIMGSLPGKPIRTGAEDFALGQGFSDPNGVYPRYKNESDVNRLARNDQTIPILEFRKALRYTNIPTSNILSVQTADTDNNFFTTESLGDTWSQPENSYNAQYPYNHVFESEGGHIREFDDTPNAKRILEYHASGTEYEIANNGARNTIIKDNDTKIVEGSDQAYIKGNKDITINGRYKILLNTDGAVGNNYDIQVGPNANVNIQVDQGDINVTAIDGKINTYAGQDYNLTVGGNMNVVVAGNIKETAFGTSTKIAQGEYHTYGNPIDHN